MSRFLRFAVVVAVLGASGFGLRAGAQEAPPNAQPLTPPALSPQVVTGQAALERMQYNPERGPLLVVAPPVYFSYKRPLPKADAPALTPLSMADGLGRRVFQAGKVLVIAPREMTVINTRPGKANLLRNLHPAERLKMLFGSFTEAQWQKAGGAGLALADLTDDQKVLMEDSWPRATGLRKVTVVIKPETPNVTEYQHDGDPTPVDGSQLRLRLSRVAHYWFSRDGQNRYGYFSGTERQHKNGETLYSLNNGRPVEDRQSEFGVKMTDVVTSHLKPGDLDFAASAFDGAVALQNADGTPLATVNALLKQVSLVTHLDVRADARVGVLPVYLRILPGQTARAGDVLMALAYGVTGAYRRLTPRLFLLTDDVEGIGTRFSRLNDWASEAEQERYDTLERLVAQIAKQKPLRYLSFSAGYNALPSDIGKKLDAALEKDHYSRGVPFDVSELPAGVRQDMEAARSVWERMTPPVSLNPQNVMIGMSMKAQWVLPEGRAVDAEIGLEGLGSQFLGQLLPEKPALPPAPAKAKPDTAPVFPATITRRALAISPRTVDEARQLVQAAPRHGFSEVWVRQMLDTDDYPVLKAAISAASAARVPVVVMPSLLRGSHVGVPERTILGQDGDDWAKAYVARPMYAQHPEWKFEAEWDSERYTEWMYPASDQDEATLLRRLTLLASLPGTRGLCLTHTTPPGYVGETIGGDGMDLGSYQGYSLEQRLRFLDSKGYDPVDLIITDYGALRVVDKDLPFFPSDAGRQSRPDAVVTSPPPGVWDHYRDEQVRARLAQIYQALRSARPTLPLYLQDRVSEYVSPHTAWYGSWDAADRVPQNPVFMVEPEGDAAARKTSKVRLFRTAWDKLSHKPEEGEWFVGAVRRAATRVQNTPATWQGIVVDLTSLSAADALSLMSALPASSPTNSVPLQGQARH